MKAVRVVFCILMLSLRATPRSHTGSLWAGQPNAREVTFGCPAHKHPVSEREGLAR